MTTRTRYEINWVDSESKYEITCFIDASSIEEAVAKFEVELRKNTLSKIYGRFYRGVQHGE